MQRSMPWVAAFSASASVRIVTMSDEAPGGSCGRDATAAVRAFTAPRRSGTTASGSHIM